MSSTVIHKGNFAKKCGELRLLKDQIATLEKEAKPLAAQIKEFTIFSGVKTDTGGFVADLDEFVVEARAKTSIAYRVDKIETVLKHRPELVGICIKQIPQVDADAINELYESGELTSDEVRSMADVTTTHNLYVSRKENMPEVVKTSAQVKKPLPLKRK